MKSCITVEIRAAEGGEDAKLLVRDQYEIYKRYAKREGLSVSLLNEQVG